LIFQFNQISIDTARFRLCLSNDPVSVEPQVFDLLVYLIENRDRVVTRDELLENLWKGKVVTDSTLGARLKDARKAVGDNGNKQEVIKTFHRRGYQFIAEVTEVSTAQSSEKVEASNLHEVLPLSGNPPIAEPLNKTHSIAVLPFDNLSGDSNQEYFSDGVTESIILNLSLFPELNTKSWSSGIAFKQQIKSLGKIPREFDVDYLVEGSIRKTEDRIRITVQLIETTTGNQVWGKRYDAEIENLFDLEEKLSRSIAATVTGQIDSDLQRIAINKGAAHQDSYLLLLAGIYHCYKFTRLDMNIAIEKLNQCLENDPNNVRAHATLFVCYLLIYLERWVVDHQASFEQAGVHISRALSLDPGNGYVQALYAEYLIFCRQSSKALEHANKALQINPNDSHAVTMKAFALEMLGEYQQALELAELGHQLDPYIPWADWNLAECQIFSGQYEKALETISNSKLDPELLKMYYIVANIKLDRKELARKALREFLQECQSSMVSMPATLAEWLQYSMSHTPFEDSSLNEDIIDCLKLAGLAEELSQMFGDASLQIT
jgi:TolB-like protein/Tfp pilus assembly protein PilF